MGLLENGQVNGVPMRSLQGHLAFGLWTTLWKPQIARVLLEQRVDVETFRQNEGLTGWNPLGVFGTILFCEKCHSSNNLQVRQKRCHVRIIKQMDSIFLQMGMVLLAG